MINILSQNINQRIISALLLITLHLVIISDIDAAIARSLIVAHIGLFLIWQPIWRGNQRLNWQNMLVFVSLMGCFIVWLDWWLLTGWVLLLTGLTGGRLPNTNQERNINLLILFFLFIELLINCAINLFSVTLDDLLLSITNYGLFILPLLILFVPQDRQYNKQAELQVDLFGAISTALLASLLLLGSITNSYPIIDQDYGTALVQTFLFIGALVLLISWLLSPRTGFSGLAELWTQSLLNIGTPFERWISDIATLKGQTKTPEEFLDKSTHMLLSLPMIDGINWQAADSEGEHGFQTSNPVNLDSDHIRLTIYTSRRIGATLLLHFGLLVRIINHFYTAKLQEQELARQAHMRAIYETGARMTHDIKNLLQSFQNITAILDNDKYRSEQTLNMLKQHLPALTSRLESALSKLQTPDKSDLRMVSLQQWWNELELERSDDFIRYSENIDQDCLIPCELFDTAINNLFENAIHKACDDDVFINIKISCLNKRPVLTFIDTGNRVPDQIVAQLFKQPLPSQNGMGVGLLQCREFAEECGYKLELISNMDGEVTFMLYKK